MQEQLEIQLHVKCHLQISGIIAQLNENELKNYQPNALPWAQKDTRVAFDYFYMLDRFRVQL